MIELTYNSFFIFYIAFSLLIVLGIWIHSHYRMRKKIIFTHDKILCQCEYCHFAYLENSIKHLNKCPQCGLYNKQNVYRP